MILWELGKSLKVSRKIDGSPGDLTGSQGLAEDLWKASVDLRDLRSFSNLGNLKISRSQELRILGSQDLRISGFQDLGISGISGISESQNLGNLKISGTQDLGISGISGSQESMDLRISGSLDLRNLGIFRRRSLGNLSGGQKDRAGK